MKHSQTLILLSLQTLLAAGCVSTATHQKTIDEAAALTATLAALKSDQTELESRLALCRKEVENSGHSLNETQIKLDEKKLILDRAQADIVRLEKVLSERNQEAGKAMTQMRQDTARLTAEIATLTAQRKLKEDELQTMKEEKEQLDKERNRLIQERESEQQQAQRDKEKIIQERDRLAQEKEKREKELQAAQATYGELIDKMRSEISRGEVTISELQGKLTVNLVEKILFDSGSAEIKSGGKEVLSRVGTILNEVKEKEIRVEGYSDNLPISPRLQSTYPSNWELSSARAISVVQFLRNSLNIPGERLSASGFAEFRPIADNSTPEGRAQNRRIQIILAPLEVAVVK